MENRLELRISRMFQSSFGSCRSKSISDVVDQPFFFPENRHHGQLIDLFSPKPQPLPTLCKPNWPEAEDRPKISNRNTLLVSANTDGRKCPAGSPISPLIEKKPKKTRNKKKTHLKKSENHEVFTSIAANYYHGWYSSDEDHDDGTTLFSSRSLSSDSSESFRKQRARFAHKSKKRGVGCKDLKATGVMPLEQGKGKVRDSFSVVKRSSDPYNDFRTSMVEMIGEKQIFGGQDLENLLQCFLSLNSHHHHRVIVEVFTEIWEVLFSDWS